MKRRATTAKGRPASVKKAPTANTPEEGPWEEILNLPPPLEIARLAAMLAPGIGNGPDPQGKDVYADAARRAICLFVASKEMRAEWIELHQDLYDPALFKTEPEEPLAKIPFKDALRRLFPKKKGVARDRALLDVLQEFQEWRFNRYPNSWYPPTPESIRAQLDNIQRNGVEEALLCEMETIVRTNAALDMEEAQRRRAQKRWKAPGMTKNFRPKKKIP